MNLVSDWTGLVVSPNDKTGGGDVHFSDSRNALLYCDKVFWCPGEYVGARIVKTVLALITKKVYELHDQHLASAQRLSTTREQLRRIPRLDNALAEPLDQLVQQLQEAPTLLNEQIAAALTASTMIEAVMNKATAELHAAGLTPSYQLLIQEVSEEQILRRDFSRASTLGPYHSAPWIDGTGRVDANGAHGGDIGTLPAVPSRRVPTPLLCYCRNERPSQPASQPDARRIAASDRRPS